MPLMKAAAMDQIIKSLSQSLGLPESAIRAGVGILLNFVKQKSAASGNAAFTAMLGLLPGASELMSATPAGGETSGGGLGGLLAKAGGLLGGNLGDAAAGHDTIAATIHYLLTGGLCRNHGLFEFPSVRSVNDTVPEALEKVLEKALSLEPEDRFPTIGEMRRAHLAAMGGIEVAGSSAAVNDPTIKLAIPGHPGIARLIPSLALMAAALLVIISGSFIIKGISARRHNAPAAMAAASPAVLVTAAAASPPSSLPAPAPSPSEIMFTPAGSPPAAEPSRAVATVFVTVSATPPSGPGVVTPTPRAPDLPGAHYPVGTEGPRTQEAPPSPHPGTTGGSPVKIRDPEISGLPAFDYKLPPSFMRVQNNMLSTGIERIFIAVDPKSPERDSVRYMLVRVVLIDRENSPDYYYKDIVKNAPLLPDSSPIEIGGSIFQTYRFENVIPYLSQNFRQVMVNVPDPKNEAMAILIAGCSPANMTKSEQEFLDFFRSFEFTKK